MNSIAFSSIALGFLIQFVQPVQAQDHSNEVLIIRIEKAVRSGLVPWVQNQETGGRKVLHFPFVRIFSKDGRHIVSGDPADALGYLKVQGLVAPVVNKKEAQSRNLSQEHVLLGIPEPSTHKPTLIIYESKPCPPCENLTAPVRKKIAELSGGSHAVIRVLVDFR